MRVTVRTAPVPRDLWGIYDHPHRLITLKPGLESAQRRSTLAHELGHAYYGHHGHGNLKQERFADQWAARQLISLEDLIEHSDAILDVGEIAMRLNVMPSTIKDFVSTLNEIEVRVLLDLIQEQAV